MISPASTRTTRGVWFPNSYDVVFHLPVYEPEEGPTGFRTALLEVDGHSQISARKFAIITVPFAAEDADTLHHYYAANSARVND